MNRKCLRRRDPSTRLDLPRGRDPEMEDAELVHRHAQPLDAADLLDRVGRRDALGDGVTLNECSARGRAAAEVDGLQTAH